MSDALFQSATPGGRVFLFAGGGTGGHIYPALAVIGELSRQAAGARVSSAVLCSDRSIDREILERDGARMGVRFRTIAARPFSPRPTALLRFAKSWGSAIRAAKDVIAEARAAVGAAGSVELVSMGGFVAAPCVKAARLTDVPVTLVNMDAVPGKSNRWTSRRARRVFTSAGVVGKMASVAAERWVRVAPIVRPEAVAPGDAATCRAMLGLEPGRPTLLVTGASQGARSINRLMEMLAVGEGTRLAASGWQIVHQCGPGDEEGLRLAYKGSGIRARVEPFFEKMGVCWGAADLAVARAGAGLVGEAWANRVPTVFMPYPHHRDQHQRHNAVPLETINGAVICTDFVDPTLNAKRPMGPGQQVLELIRNPARLAAMRAVLSQLGPADGAAHIAKGLLTGVVGAGPNVG